MRRERPRLQVAGGLYHVRDRGNRREPIFLGSDDYAMFLRILAYVVRKDGWRCHQYCLIPNHYHLLVETPDANLSRGMHRLNSTFAHAFNACHELDGHVFQSRFGSTLVRDNGYLMTGIRYIARNPIEAGLCTDAAEWRWSSFRATIGRATPPDFLSTQWILGLFGNDVDRARAGLDAFVHDRLAA
jgi:putative transposase